MIVKEIKAKSIIVKSNLPDSDYVVNPYTGCQHGCLYCYARFMKRFTDHHEEWGKFLDVKVNAAELVPENTKKLKGKSITFSSVTDPYQPIEKKYQLTRNILKKLVGSEAKICIMTKSDLFTRDIDIFKKFENCQAGISLLTLNAEESKELEPFAATPEKRINAVKGIRQAGINNFIFISPIFPEITNWKKIILETRNFVDEFWFENLNIRPAYWGNIKKYLSSHHPNLMETYKKINKAGEGYWNVMEHEIKKFCKTQNIPHKIYFRH